MYNELELYNEIGKKIKLTCPKYHKKNNVKMYTIFVSKMLK